MHLSFGNLCDAAKQEDSILESLHGMISRALELTSRFLSLCPASEDSDLSRKKGSGVVGPLTHCCQVLVASPLTAARRALGPAQTLCSEFQNKQRGGCCACECLFTRHGACAEHESGRPPLPDCLKLCLAVRQPPHSWFG